MKIYSLMLVKDEEDIIASTLRAAAQWSDKLFVMDNGSSDGTWDIVNSLAAEFPNIIPFAQDAQPFRIGLRAIMFDQFKSEMTENDWWCIRLDADEFFHDDPLNFLKNIPLKYKQVYKASIDFALTTEDITDHNFTGTFENDRDNIRYYQPYTWSEVRFMRHSRKLNWEIDEFKPKPCGLIYPVQIKVLHYQFRSPQQMLKRYVVRQKAKADGCGSFKHERGESWKDYLKQRAELSYYNKDNTFQILGNRNKFNKKYIYFLKSILTFLGYY